MFEHLLEASKHMVDHPSTEQMRLVNACPDEAIAAFAQRHDNIEYRERH